MPIPSKIIKFLEKNGVKYEALDHRIVYTAFDKATTLGVAEKVVGKTLIVKIDQNYALVIIPANKKLDKGKFKNSVNDWIKRQGKKTAKKIDFASEAWMKGNLKGIKLGAVPPFGILWKIPTFADGGLLKNTKIIINGGNYNGSLKITSSAFKKLVPDLAIGNFTASR